MRWTGLIFLLLAVKLSLADESTSKVEPSSKRISANIDFDTEDEEKPEANKQSEATSERVKAPASKGRLSNAAAEVLKLPVILPPVNVSTNLKFSPNASSRCLLYLEGINIIVRRDTDNPPAFRNVIISNGTFGWDPSFVNCSLNENSIGNANFHIEVTLGNTASAMQDKEVDFTIDSGEKIGFDLNFISNPSAYWWLTSITTTSTFTVKKGPTSFLAADLVMPSGITVDAQKSYMGVESFYQYAYACSSTPGAFVQINSSTDSPTFIGIALYNFEVDLRAFVDEKGTYMKFNRDVYDCVGTFSVGSWMGIVSSLVMATILMFGYLMLQSVQTMERFDDPKQKQIVINFKE